MLLFGHRLLLDDLLSCCRHIRRCLVKVGHIERAHLIIRCHRIGQSFRLHLRKLTRTIVERLQVRTDGIAQVGNHGLGKLGKPTRPLLDMINCHFSTDGKYLRVHTHIHATIQLVAHTLTKFCITLIGNKPVAARFGRLFHMVTQLGLTLLAEVSKNALNIHLLRLVVYGSIHATCPYLILEGNTNSIQCLLHTILGIAENVKHLLRRRCSNGKSCITDGNDTANVFTA